MNKNLANHNYSIDVLRIMAMLFIVILHIFCQGKVLDNLVYGSSQYYVSMFLYYMAYCAVNIYALISGYVMCYSRFKLSRIINIYLQVFSIMLVITVIFSILAPEYLEKTSWFSILTPITSNTYWYFSSYMILSIFIPAINTMIEKMSKRQFALIIAVTLFAFTMEPFFALRDVFYVNKGYSFMWLATLYLVGAYIRKYGLTFTNNKGFCILVVIMCIVIEIMLCSCMQEYNAKLSVKELGYNNPLVFIQSVFLFSLVIKTNFNKISVSLKKIIFFFSSTSFTVYIIHQNPIIRKAFLVNRFAFLTQCNAFVLIIGVISAAIIIYLGCSILEYLRKKLFELLKIKQIINIVDEKFALL